MSKSAPKSQNIYGKVERQHEKNILEAHPNNLFAAFNGSDV
jgi:hypothetical protein